MTSDYSAFDAAVMAVLEAATQDSADLVSKISAADAASEVMFNQDFAALRERVQQMVSPVFREKPELVPRLNFAASLAASGGQGPFFHTARVLCAERAMELSPADIPGIVESFRRTAKYQEMKYFADLLVRKLAGDVSPGAWRTKAKVSYELSMAAWQQAENTSGDLSALHWQSMSFAYRSAWEAEMGKDPIGRLYALMIVSGNLFPALGKMQEAVTLSKEIGDEAELLAAIEHDEEKRKRPLRLAMNTYFHRMNMAVEHGLGTAMVNDMLAKIEANPIYKSAKDQDWATGPVEKAREYLRQKGGSSPQ